MAATRTALVITLLTAGASAASAAPSTPTVDLTPAPAPAERHWYGGPILISDAASLALAYFVLQRDLQDNTPLLAVVAAHALVPGVIHYAHGNANRGLVSAGMRVVLPYLSVKGFVAASGCESDSVDDACLEPALLGLLVGLSSTIFLDQVLANDRHESAPPARAPAAASTFAPTFAATRHGASLGLAGTF